MKFLDIGEVASRSRVKPSALRYYEETGLITSVARRGLRRQFPPEVLLQLKLIALAKSAGFSLGEIGRMFGRDGLPDLPRPLLLDRANRLDDQIRELAVLRDTLRHIADCAAPSHMECPTFRNLLAQATIRTGQMERGEPE
nr:helix-turn-helix domain-containing protein [uncultured Gellertiella sp.]